MTLTTPIPMPFHKARKTIWRWAKHYFYGMFVKSFTSAITAVDSVIGTAVGAAVTTDISKPNWQLALAVFGTTFLRSCFAYFKDNPLPAQLPDDTNPPFPPSTPVP